MGVIFGLFPSIESMLAELYDHDKSCYYVLHYKGKDGSLGLSCLYGGDFWFIPHPHGASWNILNCQRVGSRASVALVCMTIVYSHIFRPKNCMYEYYLFSLRFLFPCFFWLDITLDIFLTEISAYF